MALPPRWIRMELVVMLWNALNTGSMPRVSSLTTSTKRSSWRHSGNFYIAKKHILTSSITQHAATAEQQRKLSRQSKPLDIYIYLYINNHTATCFAHWHHKHYDDLNIIIVGKFYFTFQIYMFANLESHHSSLQRNYELPAAFQLRLLLHNSNFMFLVNAMKIR